MNHGCHASDLKKLSFIKRRIVNSQRFSFVIIIIITINNQTKISEVEILPNRITFCHLLIYYLLFVVVFNQSLYARF